MRRFLLIQISCIVFFPAISQAPQLWGLNSKGGIGNGGGTAFNINGDGSEFHSLVNFQVAVPGSIPMYEQLVLGPDGKLYGTTSSGGVYGNGLIFSIDTANYSFKDLYDFSFATGSPQSGLMLAIDGKLYGSIYNYQYSYLFAYNPVSESLKLSSNPITGEIAGSLLQASDSNLYFLVNNVGNNNITTLYKFSFPDTTLDNITYLPDVGSDNYYNGLAGGLIEYGPGIICGTTPNGGGADAGLMFIDTLPAIYPSDLHFPYDFDATITGYPVTGNLLAARNGKFYGLCSSDNMTGTIYSYEPQTQSVQVEHSFDGTSGGFSIVNGGGLIQPSQAKMYGMTTIGGSHDDGVIFSYDPATASYQDIHDFSGKDGSYPQGTLLGAGSSKLYGLTSNGGDDYNNGVFFTYDTATNIYTKVFDFGQAEASQPLGSLTKAVNGLFYGLTSSGGSTGAGALFCLNPVTGIDSVLFQFNDSTGANPEYCQLVQLANGKLYGLAESGGAHNKGVIFSYDPSVNQYTELLDFDSANGANPTGSLMLASNGKLFGLTSKGGSANYGVIFSYDPVANQYAKLVDLTNATGQNPMGKLVQLSNGKFYGTTSTGGSAQLGVIFEYDTLNGYQTLYSFPDTGGYGPTGSLTAGPNGLLYGMTNSSIFSFNSVSNTCTNLYHFTGSQFVHTDGGSPYGDLLLASDSNFYGLTSTGGAQGYGVVFKYRPGANAITIIQNLDTITTGGVPYGNLVEYRCFTPATNIQASICAGNNYNFNGHVVDTGGIYNDTLISVTGCDSIIILTLVVNPPFSDTTSVTICPGDSFVFNGLVLNSAGQYRDTFLTGFGCDSIAVLNLFLHPLSTDTIFAVMCVQGSYNFNGTTESSPGMYYDTLTSSSGCDSFVVLILSADSVLKDTIYATFCNGQTYIFNGDYLTLPGVYVDTLIANGGCDSLVFLVLTANTPVYDTLYSTVCAGSVFIFNGHQLDSTGRYADTAVSSVTGCDSVTVLNLTVNQLPVLSATADTFYCGINQLELQAAGASNYFWYTTDSSFSSTSNPISISPSVSAWYYLSGKDSNSCTALDSVHVQVYPMVVWPGDANNDSIVNNYDVLAIGLAYGATGPARPEANSLWDAQCTQAWTDTFTGGANYAYADCNGDGVVNADDTLAVASNYGLTRSNNFFDRQGPLPISVYTENTLYAPGDTIKGYVTLGDSTTPANNIYGISYTLYTGGLAGTLIADQSASWLAVAGNRLLFNGPGAFENELAQTRINQTGLSGYGTIMSFNFILSTALAADSQLQLKIMNVLCVTNNGDTVGVNSIPQTISITTATNKVSNLVQVTCYPNPAKDLLAIKISGGDMGEAQAYITDPLGRVVAGQRIEHNYTLLNISSVAAGVYLLKIVPVHSNSAILTDKISIIK